MRIPGPAGLLRPYGYEQDSIRRVASTDSDGLMWRDPVDMDKSLDGPKGFVLLDDSYEEPRGVGKPKGNRRQSNISNGSSAVTERDDRHGDGGAHGLQSNLPRHDRGVAYLRHWLFTVRRLLATYYFITSFVLIFFLSLKVKPHCSVDMSQLRFGDDDWLCVVCAGVFGDRVHNRESFITNGYSRHRVSNYVRNLFVPGRYGDCRRFQLGQLSISLVCPVIVLID